MEFITSESASELYSPRDCRLSVKFVPDFEDRGCHVVGMTDPYDQIFGFLDRDGVHRSWKRPLGNPLTVDVERRGEGGGYTHQAKQALLQ
jgi:hypothetical protein